MPSHCRLISSMDFTFGGKYRLEEELAIGGCGSFVLYFAKENELILNELGTVFYGVHTVAGKEVAIKLEPAVEKQHSPLKHESKIYKTLMGGTGVPWMIWSGKQGDYNVMVIDLLGPSLEDLFKMCNRHFSLKTVLLLADQLVRSTSCSYPPNPLSPLFFAWKPAVPFLGYYCRARANFWFSYPASSSYTRMISFIATSSPPTSSWAPAKAHISSMSSTLASLRNSAIAMAPISPISKTLTTVLAHHSSHPSIPISVPVSFLPSFQIRLTQPSCCRGLPT